MKKTLLVLVSILISFSVFSQGWGAKSFFKDEPQKVRGEKSLFDQYNSDLEDTEARWTVDIEGFNWIMPDQPASDSFVPSISGLGATYKFSNKLHVTGKWMQFDIEGGNDVSWHHDHLLFGAGARNYFNNRSNQWQLNFLTGWSTVTGSKGVGNVKGLEAPFFIDGKYFWVFGGNTMIGPQITFGRVPNSCTDPDGTYLECGHGGYTSVGVVVQVGLPKEWGQ